MSIMQCPKCEDHIDTDYVDMYEGLCDSCIIDEEEEDDSRWEYYKDVASGELIPLTDGYESPVSTSKGE